MAEFPVTDEGIKALRIKVLRALAAATYPKEAIAPLAASNGLTVDDLRSLVVAYGYPDKSEMARFVIELSGGDVARSPQPGPVAPRVEVFDQSPQTTAADARIETLLNAASKSGKARTRRLGVRIHELVAELRGLVNSESAEREAAAKADAEKAALLAEVKTLEDQLAAKKDALRIQQSAKRVAAIDAVGKAPSTRNGRIRAWAAGQGIECTAFGRVPAAVIAAYDAEHTEQTG